MERQCFWGFPPAGCCADWRDSSPGHTFSQTLQNTIFAERAPPGSLRNTIFAERTPPGPPEQYFCRANASWRPPGYYFCRADASWSPPEHDFCRASASGRRSLSVSGSGDNLANPWHGSRAMDLSTHALIQPCIHRPFIHASIHGCAQHRNSWALSPTCVLWGQTINVQSPFHEPRDAT